MSSQFVAGAAVGRRFIFGRELISRPEFPAEFLPEFCPQPLPEQTPAKPGLQNPPAAFGKKPPVASLLTAPKLAAVTPASRLEVRPTPELVSSGIPQLDALTGGLPRGSLTEVCGPASSGRTSLLLAALAAATQRQEACALIDASDAFDPSSAAASGVELSRLLWVRCAAAPEDSLPRHPEPRESNMAAARNQHSPATAPSFRSSERCLEQALRSADLLLQSSGFGLVTMDLGDFPLQAARRIPLTTWFRFRRAVENTPTILLVIARQSCAKTCASLLLQLQGSASGKFQSSPSHAHLLEGLAVRAEVLHSRLSRKPVYPAGTVFDTRTAWAG